MQDELTKGICNQVESSCILLDDLPIQSSQVESVKYVVLVDLGKVLLREGVSNIRGEVCREESHIAFGR